MADDAPLLSPDFLTRLEQLELVSRKIFAGVMKGERRSKRKGQSVEFADYRNYVKGDDLRFLDWNLYARLDRLFLRLFLEEEDLHLYLLVDNSLSMDFGEPHKLQYARQVAAALAFVGLVNLDRVAVETTVGPRLPAVRGRRSLWRVLDFLQKVQAEPGPSFKDALRAFSLRSSGKGVVIVLSDMLHKEGHDDALRYLVARQFDIYLIHVLSPQELSPSLVGDLKLVDVEDGDEAEITITQPMLRHYQKTVQAFKASIQEFCLKRGVTYLATATDVPFERLILTYLRQRGLVR